MFFLFIVLISCAKLNEPSHKTEVLKTEYIYQTEGYAMDLFVTDTNLYIAEDQVGFSIYDLNSDSLLTHFYGDIENARLISAVEQDSTLFVYDVYGSPAAIMVYDISNPKSPVLKPNITGQTSGIEEFYCIPTNTDGIDIIWTHDNKLQYGFYQDLWLGSFSFSLPNAVKGFDYDSTYYYIAGDERGLYIVDRVSGDLISNIDTGGKARSVKLIGNFVYIAAREAGLQVINVSDINNPILVYNYDTVGYAQGIDGKDGYLSVASGGGGVYLFELSDSGKPEFLARVDDEYIGYTYNTVVKENIIFVATRQGVYKMSINY